MKMNKIYVIHYPERLHIPGCKFLEEELRPQTMVEPETGTIYKEHWFRPIEEINPEDQTEPWYIRLLDWIDNWGF